MGRAPAFRSREGSGPLPSCLLLLGALAVLRAVAAAPAAPVTTGLDRDHQPRAAPQRSNASLSANCLPDEEETAPDTRIMYGPCQCKPGTFKDKDSPEFCQKCSSECPNGKVKAKPCTPRNDLECVDQESGAPHLTTVLGIMGAMLPLLLILCGYCYRTHLFKVLRGVRAWLNRVFSGCSHAASGPEALDNAYNMSRSNGDVPPVPDPEQELERGGCRELEPSSGEGQHLLKPAGAEDAYGSQKRKRLLVPVNGEDPSESLKMFFHDFFQIVPLHSWDRLMRLMGLTDNDILVAKKRDSDPQEAAYKMLVTWINSEGRAVSVNQLLEALETLKERKAKERIQDLLVRSGKYVYEEA